MAKTALFIAYVAISIIFSICYMSEPNIWLARISPWANTTSRRPASDGENGRAARQEKADNNEKANNIRWRTDGPRGGQSMGTPFVVSIVRRNYPAIFNRLHLNIQDSPIHRTMYVVSTIWQHSANFQTPLNAKYSLPRWLARLHDGSQLQDNSIHYYDQLKTDFLSHFASA